MAVKSLFFYDLETSGVNPRSARIMQFAGQRTNLQLKPIGEPVNILIKLTEDVLPDPDAILITGITPQQTRADGITEAEFLHIFNEEVATPGTIFVGFNSVRFDDEFMRYLHYRNFYDPYSWQWQDDRGRWDLLDAVRMTRALRPDGLKWPVDNQGKPTNRLELLTAMNGLEHTDAHDALADVKATIAVARLIYNKQTKLFEYLLSMRSKKAVAELVDKGQPFVYASGKYPSEFEKTAVVAKLADHPQRQGAIVFDLRHDPSQYVDKSASELAELWRYKKEATEPRLPVKALIFNRCPAVAPLGVLDDASQKRLSIDLQQIAANFKKLRAAKEFPAKILEAMEILNKEQQTRLVTDELDVDAQLYDGFFDKADEITMRAVRVADPVDIPSFADQCKDPRLKALLPLYKARNYPKSLSSEERLAWEQFRIHALTDGGNQSRQHKFFTRLEELASSKHLSQQQRYLLEELQLYGQSIMPDPDFAD
jgi:exodeoxyribonuclease-1